MPTLDEDPIGLSEAQLEERQEYLGASDTPAALRLSPYRTPLEVWCSKRTPSRGPLMKTTASPQAEVGQVLEAGLRHLYERRSGMKATKPDGETVRDAELPWLAATPDGFVEDGGLLELKLVGARMAYQWQDGPPDYVRLQVLQQMRVTDRPHVHVGALLGGTDFRIWTIVRDLEDEDLLLEAALEFWETHIEGDLAPEEEDPEVRRQYLVRRFPRVAAKTCELDDTEETAQLHRWLTWGLQARKLLDYTYKQLTCIALEHLGERYGVEGPFGKLLAPTYRGDVKWSEVAKLNAAVGGEVPEEIADAHRGAGTRKVLVYGPSKKTEKLIASMAKKGPVLAGRS